MLWFRDWAAKSSSHLVDFVRAAEPRTVGPIKRY
jgi:hypothetical protein